MNKIPIRIPEKKPPDDSLKTTLCRASAVSPVIVISRNQSHDYSGAINQGQCSIQAGGQLRSNEVILGYFFQEILSTNCETFEQLR